MNRTGFLAQGLIAGLVGYATVALVFAIANLIGGHSPFYTAALLGGGLFYGVEDVASVRVWPGAVFAFNGLHLLLFLVMGMFAAWMAALSERAPHFWYVAAILMLFVVFHAYAALFMLPRGLQEAMLGWGTLLAGALAAVAMALTLLAMHPRLRAELRDFSAQDQDLADAPH